MKIALVPLYVDYFENAIPGMRKAKEELIRAVTAVLSAHDEVVVFERVTDHQSKYRASLCHKRAIRFAPLYANTSFFATPPRCFLVSA
jgi:hypothetical protein